MAAAPGVLLVGYTGRKTKIAYRNLPRDQWDAAINQVIAHWMRQIVVVNKIPVSHVLDRGGWFAEWVENPKQPNETRTPVPIPPVPA
jgi:hypothetical protein